MSFPNPTVLDPGDFDTCPTGPDKEALDSNLSIPLYSLYSTSTRPASGGRLAGGMQIAALLHDQAGRLRLPTAPSRHRVRARSASLHWSRRKWR